MRLEHLNLVVNDLEETLIFYRAAFHPLARSWWR